MPISLERSQQISDIDRAQFEGASDPQHIIPVLFDQILIDRLTCQTVGGWDQHSRFSEERQSAIHRRWRLPHHPMPVPRGFVPDSPLTTRWLEKAYPVGCNSVAHTAAGLAPGQECLCVPWESAQC